MAGGYRWRAVHRRSGEAMNAASKSPADEVLELLRAHGFSAEAADLQDELDKLRTGLPLERAEARRAIQQRVHPRWLGDLYLPGLSVNQWWQLLEHLGRAAAKDPPP